MREQIPLFDPIEKYYENEAIVTPDRILTYGQYYRSISETARSLEEVGIKAKEPVAILSPNSPEYLITAFALWMLGAIMVPVSTRWPEEQVTKSLHRIGCNRLILSPDIPMDIPSVETLSIEDMVKPALTSPYPGVRSKGYIATAPYEQTVYADQEGTIIFTSGSSGNQKAVLHTMGNHYYSALGSNTNIPLKKGDRWGIFLPLFHVGGLAIPFRTLLSGAAVAFPGKVKSIPEAIRLLGITHTSLVSTQLVRMMDDKDAIDTLKTMKAILLGGGPIQEEVRLNAMEHRIPIVTSYGSTEMSSQVTATAIGDTLAHILTSGRLLPFREMTISDDGEIWVRGKTLFKGYVKEKGLLETKNSGGWFRTGDLGYMDREGYLTVTGRKDNMFISGGENIQPEQVEREISRMAGVKEVIVVPVMDREYGNRPVAFIRTETGELPPYSRIRSFLKDRLPGFMIPDRFYTWPREYRQTGIKVNRHFFRELAERRHKSS